MSIERPTFVLVPGAWHLPSAYDLLRGELDKLGYASRAVKLPTTGPELRGDLRDDADAIRRAIETISGPVAVMAHSYGGIPTTEAAVDLPHVRHLVYVAAYVPDSGESMYTLHQMPDPDSSEGLFPLPADPRNTFYSDLPNAEADLAVSRLVDQLHQPFADRVTQAAWHTVPSTYIVTERDSVLPVEVQERMATRTKGIRRISTSHSPFLSRPAELAALLDDIVKV